MTTEEVVCYSQADVNKMMQSMYTQREWDNMQKIDGIDRKLDILITEHTACRAEVAAIKKKCEDNEHDIIRIKQFGIAIAGLFGGGVAYVKDLIS